MNQKPTLKQMNLMAEGCDVDGVHVTPVHVDLAARDRTSQDRICVVVQDGRHHEVRKMIAHAGETIPCFLACLPATLTPAADRVLLFCCPTVRRAST